MKRENAQRKGSDDKEDVIKEMRDLEQEIDIEVRRCPKCDSYISPEDEKCPSCGYILEPLEVKKKDEEFEKMLSVSMKDPSKEKKTEEFEKYPEEEEFESDEEFLEDMKHAYEAEDEEEGLDRKMTGIRTSGSTGKKVIALVVIIIGVISYLVTPILIEDKMLIVGAMVLGAFIIVLGGNMVYDTMARAGAPITEAAVREELVEEEKEVEEEPEQAEKIEEKPPEKEAEKEPAKEEKPKESIITEEELPEEPKEPEEPEEPAAPMVPVESEAPKDLEKPEAPMVLEEPESPKEPEKPETPEQPEEPVKREEAPVIAEDAETAEDLLRGLDDKMYEEQKLEPDDAEIQEIEKITQVATTGGADEVVYEYDQFVCPVCKESLNFDASECPKCGALFEDEAVELVEVEKKKDKKEMGEGKQKKEEKEKGKRDKGELDWITKK